MVPDEPGQLAIARFVGRGLRWNMLDHSTWRPAYGVLLAPATWITDDAGGLYRSGLALNAGLGALSCVLLALLAARVTGRSRPTCAALAAAVSLAPALLFTTDWVWSEALVQVTLLLFLLAALRFLDVGRLRWGATMVVAAAAGFATHSRLLPLAVTATALVVVACWRRDLATRARDRAARPPRRLAARRGPLLELARRTDLGDAGGDQHGRWGPRPAHRARADRGVGDRAAVVPARRLGSGSPASAPSPWCDRRPDGPLTIAPASRPRSTPGSCWSPSPR